MHSETIFWKLSEFALMSIIKIAEEISWNKRKTVMTNKKNILEMLMIKLLAF